MTHARGIRRVEADAHAAYWAMAPQDREAAARIACDPDPIELACPGCTLQLDGGAWVHERSCAFRRRTA